VNRALQFFALAIGCVATPAPWNFPEALPASVMQQAAEPAASRPQSPPATMEACIRALVDEARKSRAEGALVRTQSTFATEFVASLPPAMLVDRLLKPQHSDAFIDAYVRWQLTAFCREAPELALDDRAFERLLDSLPAFTENPRAGERFLQVLNRTVQRGSLTTDQQEEVNALLNEVATRTSAATAFNVPAAELRSWMIDHARTQSHRAAALHLERVASLAKGGWLGEAEQAKAELERGLQAMALDREFTAKQRQDFLDQAARAITTGRVVVSSAGLAGDALSVEYASAGVFDFDVSRWQKILRSE
jgi:hypothetical protein